ncbi:SDR family NAD(P)-dependent oxidoreductase [Mycobacterium sp.]|uniref:SDR family NAD(P)-dependent oxidoreductase n=1 Tax=Mycobacterium sp. TaxID=1785 RepID=UPI003BAFC923
MTLPPNEGTQDRVFPTLDGRVAIVTGGANGIGRGVAVRLAGAGASVVIADVDTASGTQTAKELATRGLHALFVETNVSRKADITALVDTTCDAFGRPTILVNSAICLSPNVLLEDKTDDGLDKLLHVGLWANWWAMKAVFPGMRDAGGGSIINFRSIDGEAGAWLHSDYNITKEAIGGLTRSAAAEWGRFNIRVNAIAPVAKGTVFAELQRDHPEIVASVIQRTPLGRIGEPEGDIGGVVAFLAGDDSRFVTGVTLPVDGGTHLARYDSRPPNLDPST